MNDNSKILDEINEYLKNRFNYKRKFAHFGILSKIIVAQSRKFDIYLRLFDGAAPERPNTIIIARIGFCSVRKGNGSDFLKFMFEIAVKYGFSFIEIENCNEESKCFAKRFGFSNIIEYHESYRIEVKELGLKFA
ncbi:hypothetical protein PF438_09565 [Elizabethkingia meningoseptica]|uniref:hypothetical protein n=1 Tax=Elizabethkingia meningoseptica TaxID=238 RepID=UPI0022F1C765|nr:hypothetical protein [Elizabethkingia meningoseptica]EJK5330264.1 hypothetical protein [Elizabethkingia meningoseptica]WBS73154.1 hypothetical protein PF438_09565 [Elizabethkingia meningoseptica]